MKKVFSRPERPSLGPRRLSISEAKAHLSDAVRSAGEAPIVIHNRGRDVAALVGIDDYERIQRGPRGATQFLETVGELKRRFGGGAELEVEPAAIRPADPFRAQRRPRKG
jgi:prevent-host-death family protein